MSSKRRQIAFLFALASGVFLLISGNHGPTGTYKLILDLLHQLTQNQTILQVVGIVIAILTAISLAGGLTVIAGGLLIFINRVTLGKIAIGLGSGAGILLLVLLAITVVTSQQIAGAIAEYSAIGWTGIILAFAAIFIAK